MPKLPVGQHEVKNWPVLDLGEQPEVARQAWKLEVGGLVEHPFTLTWDDFMALPQAEDVSDFHCVTTWSRFDNRWGGVRFRTIAERAVPSDEARFVLCTGYDFMPGTFIPYTTNLPLARALDDDVLLVHTWEGQPLPREHGGPCRMITPKLYAWKGDEMDSQDRVPRSRSVRDSGRCAAIRARRNRGLMIGTQTNDAPRLTPRDPPDAISRRVVIERVRPAIDDGRFPVKRTPGEVVEVSADIFADGHDVLAAVLRVRPAGGDWRESPMTLAAPGLDEWHGCFTVDGQGRHEYGIVAWADAFQSWRHGLSARLASGQVAPADLLDGARLLRDAAARVAGARPDHPDAARLGRFADALAGTAPIDRRIEAALSDDVDRLMRAHADRSRATASPALPLWSDRARARFGAWYEMFPRSSGPDPTRSATFREASTLLPYVADLGFDVVYLPPVHPIGRTFRKGRGNRLTAGPDDPGSPWAIGGDAGGHTAIEPGLGTLADFDLFRAEAERLGLEIALDLAFQCSPDHPWVREHPGWFRHRADGTIRPAENPPKKYQDIYPLDFECEDWRRLWQELLRVTVFWVEHGVRIFRVDNPHTKTLGFWAWLIAEVQAKDPGVVFLAEAFTRPARMRYLAKIGFSQSYTYFTWRNAKDELTEYLSELTGTDLFEYLPPEPLHEHARHPARVPAGRRTLGVPGAPAAGGHPRRELRHLQRLRALRGARGARERRSTRDSEKYQLRQWERDRPGHIKELVARVNQVRRHHRALQYDGTLRFHATDNPQIIAFSKTAPGGGGLLLMVVSLDPTHLQHGWVQAPLAAAGIPPRTAYIARDLVDDAEYAWRNEWNYVRFEPGVTQGHILTLEVRK